MKKQFKIKDNYLFNYNDYNDFLIKNIKIDDEYIIITIKYENIINNETKYTYISNYKSYIEDSFYKFFLKKIKIIIFI